MNVNEQTDHCGDIVWHGDQAQFRGFPVDERTVQVAGMSLRIASMRDATHLLDEPDFAKRFLDADIAPYGVELWPAATMLAEYIARSDAGPRRALEIGCGLGLVSIVAARLGWSMVAGDHEPSALVFARQNARLNDVESVEFTPFDWNHPPGDLRFPRILGADVLYQLSNHGPILSCLDRLLDDDGVALIADPNRGVVDRFPPTAYAAGFHVEVVPATAEGPSGRFVEGRILRLYRASRERGSGFSSCKQG